MILAKELKVAKEAAILAGLEILKVYNREFEVKIKDDQSPLTEADLKANDVIVKMLHEAFPEYSILSEESVDDESRLDNDWCWIVDPLDGTKEFIKHNDEFTVNIALSYKRDVVLGVVYAPVFKELYYASSGAGAFLEMNDEVKKLAVSKRTNNLRGLQSRSHQIAMCINIFETNKDKILSVTNMGSSLKGCRIALGEQDIYFNCGRSMVWDTAAMECIVKEAGGILRQLNGDRIIYNAEKIVNDRGFYILNDSVNNLIG